MGEEESRGLSELELELLRYLAEAGTQSSREAAEGFGGSRGYARTTVMTLLERLRQKGYVERRKRDGVWRYSSRMAKGELLRGVVGKFVERALGGSVSPLVAFLVENPDLTEEEVERLRRLLDELEGEK